MFCGGNTCFASSRTATRHIVATTFSVKSSESSMPSLGGVVGASDLGWRFWAATSGDDATEEAGVRLSILSPGFEAMSSISDMFAMTVEFSFVVDTITKVCIIRDSAADQVLDFGWLTLRCSSSNMKKKPG